MNPNHKQLHSIILTGKKILENIRLIITDGSFEAELAVSGQELGDLPWIFHDHNDQLEFIGEGSMDDIERDIYQMIGSCEWQHPEFGNCLICSSSQTTTNDMLILQGEKIKGTTDRNPPYLGLPELYTIDENNVLKLKKKPIIAWSGHFLAQGLDRSL